MTEPTTIAAGIYVRISSDPDLTRLGVQRQEQDCREYVERQGWTLVKVYEDNDLSAYNGKARPAYRQLLEDVRAGTIKAIVTWHPDRMHRNPTDLEEFVKVVQTTGCRVETIKAGNLDLSSASGQMVAGHLGVAARYESAHKAERIRRKHQELAAAGKNAGGGRPFGYEADRRTVRPAEAKLIHDAARRILEGEAMRSVCRDWNARGVPTVAGAGGWSAQVLRRLLISARISGRREYSYENGRRLDVGKITSTTAEWLGIITPDESDQLRYVLSGHRRKGQVREYLLTGGIARCGRCGEPLEAHPRSLTGKERAAGLTVGRKEMACIKRPGKKGCGRLGILAQPVEDLVAAAIFKAVDQGALARALKPGDDRGAIQELVEVQARQNQLADMFAASEITAEAWKRAGQGLKEREARAQRQIENQRRPRALDNIPDALEKAWPSLPLHRRRGIVVVLIEAVDIAPIGRRNGNRFDPDRVSLRWKA
jgi:site-specific DNA recombinase